jgi:hypothetical protein
VCELSPKLEIWIHHTSVSQPPHTKQHFPKYKEHKGEKNAITYPQANRHILHQYKSGRTPKKHTSRRATHNYYTQIKHKKTVYKHLIFNYNDLTF